jgi:hypothetical protein
VLTQEVNGYREHLCLSQLRVAVLVGMIYCCTACLARLNLVSTSFFEAMTWKSRIILWRGKIPKGIKVSRHSPK